MLPRPTRALDLQATSTRSAGVTASSCSPALRRLCAFISRCVVPPVGLPAASSHLSPVTISARRHRSGGRLHRPGHPDHPRRPRDPSLGPNPSLASPLTIGGADVLVAQSCETVSPQWQLKEIQRPRLTAMLDRAVERPVTAVCAGPGSGKTVLVSQWVRAPSALNDNVGRTLDRCPQV